MSLSNKSDLPPEKLLLLGKSLNLPRELKRLHIEILLFSILSKLSIHLLPFKYFSKTFGKLDSERKLMFTDPPTAKAKAILTAIEKQSKFLPWKPTCLLQAHTAALVLRRHNQTFVTKFGVRRNSEKKSPINAHAWIEISNEIGLGIDKYNSFSNIACFFSRGK